MRKSGIRSLPEFFGASQKIASDILELRLTILPQPRFMMLLERVEELRKALGAALKKINRHKSAARPDDALAMEWTMRTAKALRPVFKLLSRLREGVLADLLATESHIKFSHFPLYLQSRKDQARELSAKIEADLGKFSSEEIMARHQGEADAIVADVQQLAELVAKLRQWADQKVLGYGKSFERVFLLLENSDELVELRQETTFFLRSLSYKHVQASNLFDEEFYRSQLVDKGKDVRDCLKHYLSASEGHRPNKFFDDGHYLARYSEVLRLRYNPLEHYARYGEAMQYDPCQEFNALYYLRCNDDVLDANISPFRHFMHHGLLEGRPPSAKAKRFFTGCYLDRAGISLAFIGEPDDGERPAWEALRHYCRELPETRRTTDLPAQRWNGGEEGFDAFVIGKEGAARLGGDAPRNLASGQSRLLYLGNDPARDLAPLFQQDDLPLERVCAVTSQYAAYIRWQESVTPLRLYYNAFAAREDVYPFVEALFHRLARKDPLPLRYFVAADAGSADAPLISVVSIIYKKVREMLAFLEALNRQDLARPYEVVLVNDASPDNAEERVCEWVAQKRADGLLNRFMDVRIVRNAENSGNCISRNKGIETARADVTLVADGDVLLNGSSLSEHLRAYRFDDCDAVIGFFGFNMDYEFVFDWLSACEINEAIVHKNIARPNNLISKSINMRYMHNGIFNFVTRNVSFKKSSLNGKYFDDAFNYSKDKKSAYGEEDHEIGARLHFNRKRTRFIESAFSIHIRHHDSSYNANKVIANLRSWNRLIAKYPELTLVDRQYYQWRTIDILSKAVNNQDAPEFKEAYAIYANKRRVNVSIRSSRPLQILTYAWRVPYEYELFKLNHHQFTLATHIGAKRWDRRQRPLPYNIQFKPLEEIDPKAYDFAILPFDASIFPQEGVVDFSTNEAKAFLTMLEATKGMPRAAICHDAPPMGVSGGLALLRKMLADVHVVCGSSQARREWGFPESSVIWPGFSPMEYPPGSHGKGCLTLRRAAFAENPDENGEAIRQRAQVLLGDARALEYASPPEPDPGYDPGSAEWSVVNFENRALYLGEFAIYFNPTIRKAMPLARSEAMLTGTVPVTLRNHDAEAFIKNGVNGFYADSAEEMADQVRWLLEHEEKRREMSRNARWSAMDIFNIDRFLASWGELIAKLL